MSKEATRVLPCLWMFLLILQYINCTTFSSNKTQFLQEAGKDISFFNPNDTASLNLAALPQLDSKSPSDIKVHNVGNEEYLRRHKRQINRHLWFSRVNFFQPFFTTRRPDFSSSFTTRIITPPHSEAISTPPPTPGTSTLTLEEINFPSTFLTSPHFEPLFTPIFPSSSTKRTNFEAISTTQTPPGTCTLTLEEINEVKAAVDEASQTLNSPEVTITATTPHQSHFFQDSTIIHHHSMSNCAQQIHEIKTILTDIITNVNLIKASSASSDTQEILNATLRRIEENEALFKKKIDQIEKSATQELHSKVARFEKSLQNLQATINNIMSKNVDLQQKLKEEKTQALIWNIRHGYMTEAKMKYVELGKTNTSHQVLERIVKEVIPHETVGFNKILAFTNKVASWEVYKTMSKILYTQMKTTNLFLDTPYVITFRNWIADRVLSKAGEEKGPSADEVEVDNILQDLNAKIGHLLSSYATNIRLEQYDSVVRDFQENFSILESKFPEVMNLAYENNKHRLNQILPFVRATTMLNVQLGLLNALVDIMAVSSKDIFSSKGLELIYEIHRVIGSGSYYSSVPAESVQTLTKRNITAKIPSSLKFIMGKPDCDIYNERLHGYLCTPSSSWGSGDCTRRNVYLKRNAGNECYTKWYIEPKDYGRYFVIRTHGEYLFAARDDLRFDEDNHHVFTYLSGREQQNEWTIEVDGNGKLAFKNKQNSEYLVARRDSGLSQQGLFRAYLQRSQRTFVPFYPNVFTTPVPGWEADATNWKILCKG